MRPDGVETVQDWETGSDGSPGFALLLALEGLNEAFLRMLLVWAEEEGVAATARTFRVRTTTLSRLASDTEVGDVCRAYAREPFSYVTVRLGFPPCGSTDLGGAAYAQRHALLQVVQSMLVAAIGRFGVERVIGLRDATSNDAGPLRHLFGGRCEFCARCSGRWIVATPAAFQWRNGVWAIVIAR